MNTDYKTFSCYSKMSEPLKKSFDAIVDHYARYLSGNAVISLRPIVLYDFEHHCINIFKTISDYIFDEDIVYDVDKGFSQRELYILNLAVLFHSISIFTCTEKLKALCDYPLKSSEFIKEEYNNTRSLFRNNCDLVNEELNALVDIIRVHNDTSDRPELIGDLSDMLKLKSRTGKTGSVRTKFLAGILRLANKMDITSARLGNDDFENNLVKKLKEAEEKEIDDNPDIDFSKAKEDFENLHFISHIEREANLKTIILYTDDDFVKSYIDDYRIDGTGDKIFSIYSKLSRELYSLKENVFNKSGKDAHFIPIDRIKISSEIIELQKYIDDKIEDFDFNLIQKKGTIKSSQFSPKAQIDSDSRQTSLNIPKNPELSEDGVNIKAISEEIEKKLSEEIDKRHLLKFGHFRLDNKYCARDWIDTRELVETEEISSKMVFHILEHMRKNSIDCDMIVGVDLVGSLLAARLAFYLIKPLTYIIPKMVEKYSPRQDKFFDLKQTDKIIIVIDSIVTGETIQQIIDENDLQDRIEAIYAIFYRKCENIEIESCLKYDFIKKVYCLNSKQSAELFLKSNCRYNAAKKCKDRNSRVY